MVVLVKIEEGMHVGVGRLQLDWIACCNEFFCRIFWMKWPIKPAIREVEVQVGEELVLAPDWRFCGRDSTVLSHYKRTTMH